MQVGRIGREGNRRHGRRYLVFKKILFLSRGHDATATSPPRSISVVIHVCVSDSDFPAARNNFCVAQLRLNKVRSLLHSLRAGAKKEGARLQPPKGTSVSLIAHDQGLFSGKNTIHDTTLIFLYTALVRQSIGTRRSKAGGVEC